MVALLALLACSSAPTPGGTLLLVADPGADGHGHEQARDDDGRPQQEWSARRCVVAPLQQRESQHGEANGHHTRKHAGTAHFERREPRLVGRKRRAGRCDEAREIG